jgi:hypothetical protein
MFDMLFIFQTWEDSITGAVCAISLLLGFCDVGVCEYVISLGVKMAKKISALFCGTAIENGFRRNGF